jgi:hypothetical protein
MPLALKIPFLRWCLGADSFDVSPGMVLETGYQQCIAMKQPVLGADWESVYQ